MTLPINNLQHVEPPPQAQFSLHHHYASTNLSDKIFVNVEWLLQKQEAIISSRATPPLKAKEAAKALTSCALTWETF